MDTAAVLVVEKTGIRHKADADRGKNYFRCDEKREIADFGITLG
jgi:hypothetical protein